MFAFLISAVPDLHSTFGLAENPNFVLYFLFASTTLGSQTFCRLAGMLECILYQTQNLLEFLSWLSTVCHHTLFYHAFMSYIKMVACSLLLILLLAFNMTYVISLSVFLVHHSIFSFCLPFFLSSILPFIFL